jgi:YidC/Oxa1 family membrane protein insertase
MSFLFHTFFVNPLYNVLILILAIIPGADVGVAVVVLTLIVKSLLAPLQLRMITMQLKMRELEPRLRKLREQYKKDPMQLVRAQRELWREHKVRPGANFLLLALQLVIFFALYFVFFREGFPVIHTDLLYSFTPTPESVSMTFLGLIDMASRGISFTPGTLTIASLSLPALALAILAGVTQYVQARIMRGRITPPPGGSAFQDEMARSMAMSMIYVLPFMIGLVAAYLPAAIALYFLTSNLVSIGQEVWIKKRLRPGSMNHELRIMNEKS